MYSFVAYSSNKNSPLYEGIEMNAQYTKSNYVFSNSILKITLGITQYSKDIVEYDLIIITSNRKIVQKGYAINPYSELNGGLEYERDEYNKELRVIPYYTSFCNCQEIDFDFRISVDKNKVNIKSSRQVQHDLLKDTIKEGEDLQGKVSLCGYLHLED